MGGLFLLLWLAQSVAGVAAYNEQRLRQFQAPVAWGEYLTGADFWSCTLQNWQSELLAMASMAAPPLRLPAATRIAPIQAGRRAAPRDRGGRVRHGDGGNRRGRALPGVAL